MAHVQKQETSVGHIERASVKSPQDQLSLHINEEGEISGRLSKEQWLTWSFIGTYLAVGLTFMTTTAGYAQIAPLLSFINEDIGPSPLIAYVPVSNVMLSAITCQLLGCLSDIFGRRWFFIVGALISLLASVIGATAQSVSTLIVCQILFGIAKGFGLSFFWVIAEMVPLRWRFVAISGQYLLGLPGTGLAAKIALEFQYTTNSKWRGSLYTLIGANVVATVLWYLCYHPASFKELHPSQRAKTVLSIFDWVGLVLYTAGLLPLLLGITWGGVIFPWKSSQVIGGITGGIMSFICFGIWEHYLPLEGVQPLIPTHLFKNWKFQACAWATGIGAITYYGFVLVWPQAVRTLYDGLDLNTKSTLTSVILICFVIGQFVGGLIAEYAGPKTGAIGTAVAGLPLLAAAATNPQNLPMTLGLMSGGTFMVGAYEGIALTASTFAVESADEIGAAGGLCAAIRQCLAAIGTAVFGSILSNSLRTSTNNIVKPKLEETGLPESSIEKILAGIQNLSSLNSTAVPGYNGDVAEIATDAYRNASAEAYKVIIYTSAGLSAILLFLCWGVPKFKKDDSEVEQSLTEKV